MHNLIRNVDKNIIDEVVNTVREKSELEAISRILTTYKGALVVKDRVTGQEYPIPISLLSVHEVKTMADVRLSALNKRLKEL